MLKLRYFDFKIITQWVLILSTLIGFFWMQDRRLTVVEVGLQQEMKGYQIAFENISKMISESEGRVTVRLNRIEDRLNR